MSHSLEHQFLAVDGLDLATVPSPPRGAEVLRCLRELSAYDLMSDVTVEALAAHLTPPRLDRSLPSRDELSLQELRCALVQSGVPLPGSMRPAVVTLEKAEVQPIFNAKEILNSALERRRGLEEVCLWVTWMQYLDRERLTLSNPIMVSAKPSSAVAPSSDSPLATEVWELLERGGDSLLECFGIPPGCGPSLEAISALCTAHDNEAGSVVSSRASEARRPGSCLDAGRFALLLLLLRTTAERLPDSSVSWPLRFQGQSIQSLPQLQVYIPPREPASLEPPEKPAKATHFDGR